MADIIFRVHAVERMFERGIRVEEVHRVLDEGKTIEHYEDDKPYPSRLVLGWIDKRPLHVVVADDKTAKRMIVITVYEPAPDLWEDGFQRRKQS